MDGETDMVIEKRLNELGMVLPAVPRAVGVVRYRGFMRRYALSFGNRRRRARQRAGVRQGRRQRIDRRRVFVGSWGAIFNFLSTMKNVLGDLDRVEKIVKLLCFVNCTSDFYRQPEVANGASDCLLEVFGDEIGLHARSAVGVNSLPFNIPVELEMIVKVRIE